MSGRRPPISGGGPVSTGKSQDTEMASGDIGSAMMLIGGMGPSKREIQAS